MIVLGIDPGCSATGYSVVRRRAGRYELLTAGVIRTKPKTPMPHRLNTIHSGLVEVLEQWTPDTVAIEAIFRHRSSESALRLGQARGVALLAAAQHAMTVSAYNPMTVKKTVGGHGRAGKAEMIRVVSRLVGSDKPLAADAADASAIAITHLVNSAFSDRLAGVRS